MIERSISLYKSVLSPVNSSSIFVGAEREENLIRNDPEKSEFTGDGTDLNPASFRWSLCACRLGQSGSPRSGKETDSLKSRIYTQSPLWLRSSVVRACD